jgi:DNA-directed RNA polymerase subunit RPC12/RpoP
MSEEKKYICQFCNKEFKNQGGLNLHQRGKSCNTQKNQSIKECEHNSSRLLNASELSLIRNGKSIEEYGFHSVCLKCGELIGGENNE